MATRPMTAPVYDLAVARRQPSARQPIAHQSEALARLKTWSSVAGSTKGGILVLPTGGGKTFTAARYLTTGPLGRGHLVLWLAHTHHLLEQALDAFGRTDRPGLRGGTRAWRTRRTALQNRFGYGGARTGEPHSSSR